MEIKLKAEEIDEIRAAVGDTISLESLRQTVIPPYLMLMPFCELPDYIEEVEMRSLDEDGVHVAEFVLKAKNAGEQTLVIGFKDLQSGEVTHKKEIRCNIR